MNGSKKWFRRPEGAGLSIDDAHNNTIFTQLQHLKINRQNMVHYRNIFPLHQLSLSERYFPTVAMRALTGIFSE